MKKTIALSLLIFMLLALFLCSCNGDPNAGKGLGAGYEKPTGENVIVQNPPQEDPETEIDAEMNSFIQGIGGVCETFKGTVSENSYSSQEEAALAYLSEQVIGNEAYSTASAEIKASLTESEINALNIPTEYSEGIVGVELVEVSYSLAEADEAAEGPISLSSETLNTEKTVKVYVIKYTVDWKYFSPMPLTGDSITRDYYNSVFNSEKYENCTFEYDMSIEADGSSGGESIYVKMQIHQLLKYADKKIYMEQTLVSEGYGAGSSSIYAYMEENDGIVSCYIKTSEDGEWYLADLTTIGFSDLEELTPFYDQYLDYSYFTKTSYGFALENKYAAAYLMQALESSGLGGMIDNDTAKIDMYAQYFVNEGALSGMRLDADVDINVTQGDISVSVSERVNANITCTDYGTTVVEKPFS